MSRSKRRKKHRAPTAAPSEAHAASAAAGHLSQPQQLGRAQAGSFGALLREARAHRGISHDDVARDTRIARHYLIALENESISDLPGGLYNRAYVRTYAEYLGLDADALMRDYDLQAQEQKAAGRVAAQPDDIAVMRAVMQQRQSQTAVVKDAPQTSKGLLILRGVAILVLAGGTWVGARRFSSSVEILPAELSVVPMLAVSDSVVKPEQPLTLATPPVAPATPEPPRADPQLDRLAPVAPVQAETMNVAVPENHQGSTSLTVSNSGVGTDVVNRELVGRSDTFAVGTRVVFWTSITGARAGDSIRHVWIHEGRAVANVKLPIGGTSWRTRSQRMLAQGADGEWVVEAQDESGRVLAQHAFRVL